MKALVGDDLESHVMFAFNVHKVKSEILKSAHVEELAAAYGLPGEFAVSPRGYALGATLISNFSIHPLKGCPAVAILSNARVYTGYENRGVGKILHRVRLDACIRAKFSLAICTVEKGNAPQEKILDFYGWTCGRAFFNANTDHAVRLWQKALG